MIPWIPVLVLGGLALAVVGGASAGGSSSSSGGSHWTRSDGVRLNDKEKAFLDRLAAKLSFPIVVTNGLRTPEDMARILKEGRSGGKTDAEFLALYGNSSAIREVLAHSENEWASVIAGQVARHEYLSAHLRGDALDIGTRGAGLGSGQIEDLISAIRSLGVRGGNVFEEDNHGQCNAGSRTCTTSNRHVHVQDLP